MRLVDWEGRWTAGPPLQLERLREPRLKEFPRLGSHLELRDGIQLDIRRFRPNVVVRLLRSVPFQEDEWLGGVLSFGDGVDAPAITVAMRDVRCSMVNLDPDSASPAPEVLKAVVRANQNNAGIYGAVTRIGRLAVGQTILLHSETEKR